MAEASGDPTGSGGVRSIPTEYAGVTFRSRLEATWAYNLDAWGIRWSYEPEGVILPSGARYLPDFWLPEIRTWLEVKGPGVGGLEKTQLFASLVQHRPECRAHSTFGGDPNTCPTCGPRERCTNWNGHDRFSCCGWPNSFEPVFIGWPAQGSRPNVTDIHGILGHNESPVGLLWHCRKYQLAGYRFMACRLCGDQGANIYRLPDWQQMQWMPNGGVR